ncbi:hypothetical protein JYT71_00860 [Acidimicrobiaceae bacterium AH-315-P05]|nr:hypothetical protein [Acidimicrobiaceae bacterium AH-315-P05]
MNFPIPAELEHFRSRLDGRAWLESLPRLVTAASDRWDLDVGRPYVGSHASWVAPATRSDGTAAVLKVPFPHDEARHEATALALWNGHGAVRLLEHDIESGDMVLERLVPGVHLSSIGNDPAIAVYLELLPRLWVSPAGPFDTVADEAARWARSLRKRWESSGRLYDERLLGAAILYLSEAASAPDSSRVLVHQDMHADNIVSARREPWLAIDPKPLSGPREFAIAPIVRSTELGHSRSLVLRRFDRLVEGLSLDGAQARAWTIGHAVAWGTGSTDVVASHIETATWLLDLR